VNALEQKPENNRKGKLKKKYPNAIIKMFCERLKLLSQVGTYLCTGIILDKLDIIDNQITRINLPDS